MIALYLTGRAKMDLAGILTSVWSILLNQACAPLWLVCAMFLDIAFVFDTVCLCLYVPVYVCVCLSGCLSVCISVCLRVCPPP